MADLQALRDELLGQLCRRCAGCDKHDANGEGGGTQDGGSKSVKEPVRVKSPEEIARDFINAETGGWQSHCKSQCRARQRLTCSFPPISVIPLPYSLPSSATAGLPLQGVEGALPAPSPHLRLAPSFTLCLAEPLQGKEDSNLLPSPHLQPLQGTAAPNLLLSPHLRYPPALLSAWQRNCKAQERLTSSFPPISVIPLPYSLPGRDTAGQPLQGTAAPNLLLSPHLRYPPALLSAWQRNCKAQERLTSSFPPISVIPLPYSLPGRDTAGQPLQGTAAPNLLLSPASSLSPCRTLCLEEPLQGTEDSNLLLSPHLQPLQGTEDSNLLLSPHLRLAPALLSAWQSHCRAYKLEYPILEKTADGKLSSKPDYNRPLYEEKVKWCRKWVEHAVTNLGVGYDEDRDVFVFGNGILIDASDYAAGFKTTTIVLQ
ncbi:unnamed protein product [Closterium sp. NIES-65]|nr:unnamed protein product [Closterium sp. NIES-65]